MTQNIKGEARLITAAISRMLNEGATGVLVTLIELPSEPAELQVGARMLSEESGAQIGSLGASQLDEAAFAQMASFLSSRAEAKSVRLGELSAGITQFHGAQLLFERIEAEPRLVVAGAGHVGAALARLAAVVGYRVTLIDDRAEFLKGELFSAPVEQGIELVVAADWADAVRAAIGKGRSVSVAIVTRGHKQDEDCLRATIMCNPAYIGMIGSKRRTNIVLEKLRAEGADQSKLSQVRAPVGLDIGAVSPEEVALAILAEIVAERRSGSGGSLSLWRRK